MKDFYLILFSPIFKITIYLPNVKFFVPGDAFMSQLLSIVHEIQSSFDYKLPTDGRAIIFLHISKAFDKGWHQGLLSKLKSYGVEGDLFRILEIRLDTRKQRVTLDRQCLS